MYSNCLHFFSLFIEHQTRESKKYTSVSVRISGIQRIIMFLEMNKLLDLMNEIDITIL